MKIKILSKIFLVIITGILHLLNVSCSKEDQNKSQFVGNELRPLEIRHIYGDGSTYCAFTSLIKHDGIYYLAFREAKTHVSVGDYGVIKVLSSVDGDTWKVFQTLSELETDLRDPSLSIMPDGRLLLICGARRLTSSGKYVTITEYSIMENGLFPNFISVNYPEEMKRDDYTSYWIWRLTWCEGIGYGVCYKYSETDKSELDLMKTTDGINYEYITSFIIDGKLSETKLLFRENGEMMAFVRREPSLRGMMGVSQYPYCNWSWKELGIYLAGHEVFIDNGKLFCATRTVYNIGGKTAIFWGGLDGDFCYSYTFPVISYNQYDTGYVGVIDAGASHWISFYSTHETDMPSVYLAKIPKSFFN